MRSCHGYAIDRKADGIYAARSMVAHRKEEVAVAGRWAQGDERMEIGNDSIAMTAVIEPLISGINAYTPSRRSHAHVVQFDHKGAVPR